MSAPLPHPRYNYDDYLLLPEEKRYEIIDGDLLVVPSPGFAHQGTVGNLYAALRQFVQQHRLGIVLVAPFDVVLSYEDILQPDVIFVSNARRSVLTAANAQGAPDLAIEVLSPSSRSRDQILKRKRYAEFGLPEYWIVDPVAKAVTVLVLHGDNYEELGGFGEDQNIRSTVLPDLALPAHEVFEGIAEVERS